MKLIDFSNFEPIKTLKANMGLAEDQVGGYEVNNSWVPLTPRENARLENAGIDVQSDEIRFLSDGTLAYRDRRVLVYIRDVTYYRETERLPKFHIAHCRTLDEMMSNGRFSRYVVSTRTDGYFEIRRRWSGYIPETVKLDVCKNCLDKSFQMHQYEK